MLFEEAALIYEADGTVTIEAPWMRTTISNWPGRPSPEELYAFPSIQKLPYWYHSPRPREALPIGSQDAYLDGIEILFETAESLIGESCDWELDALLKKSLIQTMDMDEAVGFDPFAAYAVLQRFVLVNGLKLNRLGRMVKDKFAQDGQSPSPVYRELLVELVHFSYFVTRACPAVLEASRNYAEPAGQLMARFVAGERGHEHFAIHSLQLLTESQSSCMLYPIRPELKLLMNILKVCVTSSPLGLAACLFCFEGLSYDSPTWSPWKSLEALDQRHGETGVGRHAQINQSEKHSDIGFELARLLPVQQFEDVCLAARLTELCVKTRLRLFSNVLKGRLDFETYIQPVPELSIVSQA